MRRLLTLPVLLLVLAGCGQLSGGASASLDGTTRAPAGAWRLTAGTTTDGALDLAGNPDVTLEVDGSTVRGVSACNHYTGTVRVEGDRFVVEELGGTEMGCEPEVMALEQRYLTALATVDTVEAGTAETGSRRLVLTGTDVRLEYAPIPPEADVPLTGTTWHLDTLLDGDVASSTNGDGTLRLDAGGRLAGSAGCLPFEGGYLLDGDVLTTTDVHTPGGMTDCSWQEQHDHVLAVLASDPTTAVDGARLTLTALDGRGLVYRAE
jgi:heat shock protein HslJ